jgi:hypothetical protein
VMQNPDFLDWVRTFRCKFIVNGFLMPLHAIGGRFSIDNRRVSQFGD